MIALYEPFAVTTHYFLQAILIGLCLGVFYDVLTGVQLVCRQHRWITYIMDSIFWMVVLVVYFVFTVTVAVGQVRGFILVGMGGGVIVCHLSVGWLVRRMTGAIFKILVQIGCGCIQCIRKIGYFMQLVWRWFQKKLKKIFKKTSISGKKTI